VTVSEDWRTLGVVEITHFGHSCVLLDTGSARLLIDPGTWSEGFEDLTGLDSILITHQHVDHLDGERLPALLRGNPGARLIVDSGSAAELSGHDHEVAAPGETLQVAGVRVEVLGGDHAVIYPDVPVISTTPTSSMESTYTPATRSARRRPRWRCCSCRPRRRGSESPR
jgi:L-ascorbate metabolism protein UlaG (beta-lactamase superfamily)